MALQLLLETYAEVTSLKTIESAYIFEGKRITIVLLPHSVVLINADTGLTLQKFDFPKKKATTVVDCVYVHESRCFLVAFAGSSLAAVAENAVNTANIDHVHWPQQPLRLFSIRNKGVVVVCADSTVWHVTLNNGVVPPVTFIDPAPQDYKNTLCVGACSAGESISIVRKKKSTQPRERKGKKCDKVNQTQDEELTSCSVLTWNIPHAEPGSNRILSERSSIISEFPIGRGERIVNICGHLNSRSLSILVAPSSSSSFHLRNSINDSNANCSNDGAEFRWLKFDNYDGTLLFERRSSRRETEAAGKIPLNIIASGNFLWMIFNSKACLWDARYGVELSSLAINIPEAISSDADVDTVSRNSGLSVIFSSEGAATSQMSTFYLTMCIPHKEGGSVFRIVLKIPTSQISGSLCNALGRLLPTAEPQPYDNTATATPTSTEERVTSRKSKPSRAEVEKRESKESILSMLPEDARYALVAARIRLERERESVARPAGGRKRPIDYEAVKEIDVEIGTDENKVEDAPNESIEVAPPVLSGDKKQRKRAKPFNVRNDGPLCVLQFRVPFHVDLSVEAAHIFLEHFNNLYPSAPHSSDWDTLEAVLASGTVSGSRNGQSGNLVDQVIDANRFDILAQMARHIPDLSEKNAVRYLFLCATASDEVLEHLYTDFKGRIRYHADVVTFADNGVELKKSEKRIGHGELMTIMMECILRRSSSYSTILLSDALKKLITPSFSVILLRVVTLFLKGLCTPLVISLPLEVKAGEGEQGEESLNNLVNIFTSASIYTGSVHKTYGDEHVQRAITWAEALLDSHFSALAFRSSFHAATRHALGCVMDTVATADEAAQEVEKVLGMWTHVCRVTDSGGEHKTPNTSLYQQERLQF